MGFWSSVGSAVSSVCATVCRVASGAVDLVKEVSSMALSGLSGVATVICNIAKALGFIEQDVDPEEIGDRIIQAEDEGITLESCEGDYIKYMEAIKNFKVDPEKSKNIDKQDKLIATSVVVGARIESHYGQSIAPLVPLIGKIPEFFNGGRLMSFLDSGMSVAKVAEYFKSALDRKEASEVEGGMVVVEKQSSPDVSDKQLSEMLRSMRQ